MPVHPPKKKSTFPPTKRRRLTVEEWWPKRCWVPWVAPPEVPQAVAHRRTSARGRGGGGGRSSEMETDMDLSENSGFSPKIIHWKIVLFHYKNHPFWGGFGFSPYFWKGPGPTHTAPPTKYTPDATSQQVVWKPCKILRSVAPGGATSWFLQYKRSRCLPQIEERVKVFQFQSAIFFCYIIFMFFLEVF